LTPWRPAITRDVSRIEVARTWDAASMIAKTRATFFAYLSGDILDHLLLPIGEMTKDEVRDVANEAGLRTWNEPDSQDVCFIRSDEGRAGFLGARATLTPAEVVDAETGDVVGTVPSAELVTLGQRRGVAPGLDGTARFVTSVDIARRRVEIGPVERVTTSEIYFDDASVTWSREALEDGSTVSAQWSAHGRPQRGTLSLGEPAVVRLDTSVRVAAPGQSLVLYAPDQPDVVVGAAMISLAPENRR
jgi:tRNA-specific 2-thiouridylase